MCLISSVSENRQNSKPSTIKRPQPNLATFPFPSRLSHKLAISKPLQSTPQPFNRPLGHIARRAGHVARFLLLFLVLGVIIDDGVGVSGHVCAISGERGAHDGDGALEFRAGGGGEVAVGVGFWMSSGGSVMWTGQQSHVLSETTVE